MPKDALAGCTAPSPPDTGPRRRYGARSRAVEVRQAVRRRLRGAKHVLSGSARAGVVMALLLAGCRGAPSKRATLEALERSPLSHDTATVFVRVWQDGPPWFSCAEVIAKFAGPADTAVVRDQVGNWRPLVLSGWVVLRDTAQGVVSDPGWCAAKLTDQGTLNRRNWIPVERDSFPTGQRRRGWTVPVGHQRLSVADRPTLIGKDTARAEFAVSIVANVNGAALHADRDSTLREALLVRADGGWRVIRVER